MCFEQVKAKKKKFMCDFILFLKNKIKTIFKLEYMCSIFTYVQNIYYPTPHKDFSKKRKQQEVYMIHI